MKNQTLTLKAAFCSLLTLAALTCLNPSAHGQILLSSGSSYSQNFDTLATTGGPSSPWTDNSTLAGWYAAKQSAVTTNYISTNGSANNGALYSFGVNGETDRALGSASSGTPNAISYGVRFQNDTIFAQTNITISYTGEQWRNGGNATAQPLAFYFRIDNSPIVSPEPAVSNTWTAVPGLTFMSPTVGTTIAALNGNASTNRQIFTNIVLSGVVVGPGQEIFFRWHDINDAGNDHGMGVDDVSIQFTATTAGTTAPTITTHPASVTVRQGNSATFTAAASGSQPITYQWYLTNAGSSSPISGAVGLSFTTNYVPLALSGAGFYIVADNGTAPAATSSVATITVTNAVAIVTNISYLHSLTNASFALTDTTNLYQIEGIVTTPITLVSSPGQSFFIQDATGGIDIFFRGSDFPFPAAGDLVRVTAPLEQFGGLLELHATVTNQTHNVQILSSGNPLPAPKPFDFSTPINPFLMESSFEGSLVVLSNVYLTVTNADGRMSPAASVFATNLTGQSFRLSIPNNPAADPVGYFLPNSPATAPFTIFASSVKGVMNQNATSGLTNGYNMYLSLLSDITVGTPPPPSASLSVKQVGNAVELSWPTNATGFSLESSGTLPATTWSAVGGATVVGSNNVVTVSNPTGNVFYRLRYAQ